ncbi:MAG: hypothetical protein JRD47_04455 [Deltaproteobacteria bacterium]|nr:hypothetical protein [Deltaproteobacteria bacterium]OEU45925.1 MAG: hypothetical protein BBJ60_03270 [Desulfobacterales bacterium S7086C20]
MSQETRCCANCDFWKQRPGVNNEGFCRKNAPFPKTQTPRTTLFVTWPITLADDWCGEFRPSIKGEKKLNSDGRG